MNIQPGSFIIYFGLAVSKFDFTAQSSYDVIKVLPQTFKITTSPQLIFNKHTARTVRCDHVPQKIKITTSPQILLINIEPGPKQNPLNNRSTS